MTTTATSTTLRRVRHTSGALGTITDSRMIEGHRIYLVKRADTGTHHRFTLAAMLAQFTPVDDAPTAAPVTAQPANVGTETEQAAALSTASFRQHDHTDQAADHEERTAYHAFRMAQAALTKAQAEESAAEHAFRQAERIYQAARTATEDADMQVRKLVRQSQREVEQADQEAHVTADIAITRDETAMIYADRKHRSTDDRPRTARTWLVNDLATYHGQPVVVTRTDTLHPHQVEVMRADRSRVVAHADDLTPRRKPRANADQAATTPKPGHRRPGQCRGCDANAEGTAINATTKRRRQVCKGCASTGHTGYTPLAA